MKKNQNPKDLTATSMAFKCGLVVAILALLCVVGIKPVSAQLMGDYDGSGVVDEADGIALVEALTDRAAYQANHPGVDLNAIGDLDGSGKLDLGDLGQLSSGTSSASGPSAGSGPVSIYLSPATGVGQGASAGAPLIDISGGGSGSLGIWVDPGSFDKLNGLSLDLVSDTPGVIEFQVSSFVPNPSVGSDLRWFDGIVSGANIETITDDSMFNIIGLALDLGLGGTSGVGLGETNDDLYDSSPDAYLFAVIDYDIVNPSGTTNLFLSISANGIIDGDDNLIGSNDILFADGGSPHAILGIVPEPTTLLLAMFGATSMFLVPRRRR